MRRKVEPYVEAWQPNLVIRFRGAFLRRTVDEGKIVVGEEAEIWIHWRAWRRRRLPHLGWGQYAIACRNQRSRQRPRTVRIHSWYLINVSIVGVPKEASAGILRFNVANTNVARNSDIADARIRTAETKHGVGSLRRFRNVGNFIINEAAIRKLVETRADRSELAHAD